MTYARLKLLFLPPTWLIFSPEGPPEDSDLPRQLLSEIASFRYSSLSIVASAIILCSHRDTGRPDLKGFRLKQRPPCLQSHAVGIHLANTNLADNLHTRMSSASPKLKVGSQLVLCSAYE